MNMHVNLFHIIIKIFIVFVCIILDARGGFSYCAESEDVTDFVNNEESI